jgi:putative truncated prophage lambdaSa1, minor structural protein
MIKTINEAINRKLNSMSFTTIVNGKVTSLDPLTINIEDRLNITKQFIEPKSLGLDKDGNGEIKLKLFEEVQLIRYNNGQRFYLLRTYVPEEKPQQPSITMDEVNKAIDDKLKPAVDELSATVVLYLEQNKFSKEYDELLNRPFNNIDDEGARSATVDLKDKTGGYINKSNSPLSQNIDNPTEEPGVIRHDILSIETGVRPNNGFLTTYNWHTNQRIDTQVLIPNSYDQRIKIRFRQFDNTWLNKPWKQVAYLDDIHPVGSIYMSMNNTNPSRLFGGTWRLIAPGQVLVGVNEASPAFGTSRKTGGEQTHKMTIDEMPSHNHELFTPYTNNGANRIIVPNIIGTALPSDPTYRFRSTENTGGGKPFNLMQPYLTCYIWERIS